MSVDDGTGPPLATDTGSVTGPLAGLRVLDFSRVLAGPYCSMLLGDDGADVIKVERPGDGDDTRRWGPPFVGGESVYFMTVNRNKRGIAIDLRADEGRELALGLAAHADVVLENFRPGTMDRLGLGYGAVREVAPSIVYCSMSGYGARGPRRAQAGYDALIAAAGGLMGITGERGGAPVKPGVALLDVATGISAHGAICAALFHRERTGRGQHVELSLYATQIALLINAATNHLMAGEVMEPWGSAHPSIAPYQAFRAADGYVMIGAPNELFWRKLCRVLQLEELTDDPRFVTNAERVANRDELIDLIAARIASRNVDAWVTALDEADVPVAPINDVAAALADPQVAALGLVQEVEHPTAGRTPIIGPAVGFASTPATVRHPSPCLGQHTDEVMTELLGLGPERLAGLRERRIIA